VCGIAGYYGSAGPRLLGRMLDAIRHRGPDAVGEYCDPDGASSRSSAAVALGHRRLSVIDLSARSDQPFRKNGLVIVYNGEIYNYRDLAAELRCIGAEFITNSDTEVVVEAWRHWGAGCLRRLRGMFAFALYDERTKILYLARDPLGIKPLFIFRDVAGLVFASEPKAILRATGPLAIDWTGIVASLLYGWVPESHCAYLGMRKLQPGTWAECRPNGEYHEVKYFDVDQLVEPHSRFPIGASELRAVIEESVAAHTIADVRVAVLLSGGLDSSIVTALAARQLSALDCFTIRFRTEDSAFEAMPDDPHYARLVARLCGVPLHEIEISPKLGSQLSEIVRVLDEPIGDAAAINTLLICQAARAVGAKVLLSGMGADEMFGGYRRHSANILARRYRYLPRPLRHGLIEPIVKHLPVASVERGYRYRRWAKRFIQFASLDEASAYRRSYTYYGEAGLARVLAPELLPIAKQLIEEHAEIYAEGPADDHVNRMCLTDIKMFLPGLNLTYSDRASMAASTELRVPFVDVKVLEAAFRVPGVAKNSGRAGKVILKKAAAAWLPGQVIYRPKSAFGAPLRSWIRRDLAEMVDDLLIDNGLGSRGLLRRDVLIDMIREDREGIADHGQRIWNLLTLELWFRGQASTPRERSAKLQLV
jgi:asparagine synthase (glutamine-hydrolysing)